MYEAGDRVLVNSALTWAWVTEVHERKSGMYYIVAFKDGHTCWRYEGDLTDGRK